ncbi:MAG: exopolysaccharide biosynthesis polyprenyl glycosylphosphotransferase [Rhodospirillales bacterium]|nr:exopolysaccharide biosynthesis polyprenyl glycosylphosphotransferase [Rhodospirillales bacterium]
MNEDANFQSTLFQWKRECAHGSLAGADLALPNESLGAYLWPANSQRSEREEFALPQIIKYIDNIAVIGITIILMGAQRGTLSRKQLISEAFAYIVGLLVFFLASRRTRLEHVPTFYSFLEQIRFFMPAVIVGGAAQAAIFWWLGKPLTDIQYYTGAWVLAAATGLSITRGFTLLVLRQNVVARRLRRKIAVIGYDRHAFSVADRLQEDAYANVEVLGIFSDEKVSSKNGVSGSIADLVALGQETDIYGIVIALPPSASMDNQLLPLSLKLRNVLADVFILPYLVHVPEVVLPTQSIGKTMLMVLQRRPLNNWQKAHKRALDISLSLLALVMFFAPLFVVVATLIKLDSPGPVLFRQPRRGLNNRTFTVFKFRTMHASSSDIFATKQTSRNDPRVTRVGRWLRKLSIDELPQLLNVLRGEMSLVGPRPHALHTKVEGELLDRALADYLIRYQVKPGITGWAQINGARGELVTREDLCRRVAYDLEYIQRWSFRFDLKIIFMTAVKEIISKHAF